MPKTHATSWATLCAIRHPIRAYLPETLTRAYIGRTLLIICTHDVLVGCLFYMRTTKNPTNIHLQKARYSTVCTRVH